MRLDLHAGAILAAALALSACGNGEELVEESSLRECLADEGMRVEAPDLASGAALGNVSPDFRVLAGQGTRADVVVQGTEQKAKRSAADIRGALASFGAGSEVVARRNAIVVYEQAPSETSRAAIEGCLER